MYWQYFSKLLSVIICFNIHEWIMNLWPLDCRSCLVVFCTGGFQLNLASVYYVFPLE
jgi:hypothetical protein